MKSIQILQDRLLVKRINPADTTKGGLYIPDTAKKAVMTEGKVLLAGPGRVLDNGHFQETTVKPDDRILFGEYNGTDVTIDGEEYLIIRESDVLAVL